MKVDSLTLRNNASSVVSGLQTVKKFNKQNKVSSVNFPPFEYSPKFKSVLISFTANNGKNLSQLASISSEYQGTLDTVYKIGGEGNVAGEAAAAMQKHGNMDFRTFIPYYSPDNQYPQGTKGFIKVRRPLWEDKEKGIQKMWERPVMIDGKKTLTQVPAYEFVSESIDYKLQPDEQFVIHQPVRVGKEWDTGYQVLNDTGISGTVKGISDDLSSAVDIPYKLFAIQDTGASIMGKPAVYVVHTPGLAVFPQAYGGEAYAGKMFDDYLYSIFSKASVDAIEKMNTPELGNFNPGNIWLHDRQAFPAMLDIADRSHMGDTYWNGLRIHGTFHNPGRDYQGHYTNPVDFFRIVGTDKDLEELKKNPDDFIFVKQMTKKIEQVRSFGDKTKFAPETILTKEEMERLHEIFDPLYANFKDELGEYNMCKIPVAAVRTNPYNFSAGTVSRTYGKEMRNPHTKEIAYGLTSDFASIPTVDIVNGSSAKSLKLDIIGNFGQNNGFTDEVKQGFTPLTDEIMKDKDKLFAAKQANKKWVLDVIASNSKDQDTLAKLFFSPEQIANQSTVLGKLNGYKEGDVLFIGWGRADTQKGFPTTLEGFLDFFKNPDIPEETKSHAKVLLGAGPWAAEQRDWEIIQNTMKEIQELDGGKYSGNVCYLNGRFSNRIVACADYSNITSRYEPCGITPLESYAAGTPVISNNTGGSPDFIKPLAKGSKVTDETGFLTKHAYLVNPEVVGAEPGLKGIQLDDARRIALGKENSDCIAEAIDIFHNRPDEYKQMMANAVGSKIDWHENGAFNQGKSAIALYKENAWNIDKDNMEILGKERCDEPLHSIKGSIKQKTYSQGQNLNIKNNTSIFGECLNKVKKFVSINYNRKCLTAVGCVLGVSLLAYIGKRLINKTKN